MSHIENITRIRAVHEALEELKDEVVFVGGATVSLYSDRPTEEIRTTDDVDILIELIDYSGYAAVEEKLRDKGFTNDVESGVICRYRIHGVIVDVMPTNENILGFANAWYPDGYRNAIQKNLGNGSTVRIFQAAYFIASKLEAFKGRGDDDGRISTDFEDIVYVLNSRNSVWDELKDAPPTLKQYLQRQFRDLVEKKYIDEWISAHLDYTEKHRTTYIIGGLRDFAFS